MKTPFRIAAAGALALALAACSEKSKTDPYLQNMPDAAALTLESSASAPAAAVTGVVADPVPATTLVDDLALVHQKAEAMNEAIRDVFAHVSALTSSGGTELPGGVKQWGPAVRCVEPDGAGGCVAGGEAKLVLRARRWTDNLGDFVVLATSVAGSTFEPVVAGYLIRGPMDHRGAGKLWVNHPNLHDAAPGFKGTGYLAAGFAAGPVAKRATYRLLNFSRDPAVHPPVTAAFTGWKSATGVVRARVAGVGELYANPGGGADAGPELGLWRAVWAPTFGGRAFTVIAGGDVTAGKYWFARACYPAGQSTPSYKEWFECTAGDAPAACVIAASLVAGSHQGTVDPNVPTAFSHWSETTCWWDAARLGAEPDDLSPPSLEPRDQNDDRDEDGADHAGLLPEACPSTASAVQNPDPTPPGMMGNNGMM